MPNSTNAKSIFEPSRFFEHHDFKVFAESRDWGDSVALIIVADQNDKRYFLKCDVELIDIDKIKKKGETIFPRTSLEFSYKLMKKIVNALKEAGIKAAPDGTEGQLAAVKYHLEDMRKLVFEKKPIK